MVGFRTWGLECTRVVGWGFGFGIQCVQGFGFGSRGVWVSVLGFRI